MLKKIIFLSLLSMFICCAFALAQTPAPKPTLTPSPPPYPIYFSFASDTHDDGPTFEYVYPCIFKIIGGYGDLDLMMDSNADYPGGVVTFNVYVVSGFLTNPGPYILLYSSEW